MCGLWVCPYDQGDHWQMVPKCMIGYRSHECQWCILGICQHQFCLLEQRSAREPFPTNSRHEEETSLGFSVCYRGAMGPFPHSLKPGWTSALQPEEVFKLLDYVTHGPWLSQWSCGCMPFKDTGGCVDLPFIFCSAGKVNAAAASAVIPTPWTAVGQRIWQWLTMQEGIAASFPSCAGHLTLPQCAVISYRILETTHLQKPPKEKKPNQCFGELRGELEHLYASYDSQRWLMFTTFLVN